MVPNTTEISTALHGAILLARLDPTGLRYFDRTVGGFWRSFFAAVMVAPVRIIMLIGSSEIPAGANLPRALAIEAIAYVIGWLIYPFAMLFVIDLLKRRERYFDYMVPYNWANVPAAGLSLMAAALGYVLPSQIATLLAVVVLFSVLIYQWFIARVALVVGASVAVALVLLDLVLFVAVAKITERLLQG